MPDQCRHRRAGQFRRSRHPAKGDACGCYGAIGDGDVKATADGRDVLVEPFRELVTPQVWGGFRDRYGLDEFASCAVLFAVVDKEVFDGQVAAGVAFAQVQCCAQRDEGRRVVTDRRPVGDIAADCGGVADLFGPIAADHFCVAGVVFGHEGANICH